MRILRVSHKVVSDIESKRKRKFNSEELKLLVGESSLITLMRYSNKISALQKETLYKKIPPLTLWKPFKSCLASFSVSGLRRKQRQIISGAQCACTHRMFTHPLLH